MANFSYKFKSVQKVKEILKKQAQKEVAIIDIEIDRWNKEYADLVVESFHLRKCMSANKIKANELQQNKNYELTIIIRQKAIEENIKQLNSEREMKMQQLIKKNQEFEVFNTLEEIYKEEVLKEENRLDLIRTDEIATERYVRRQK